MLQEINQAIIRLEWLVTPSMAGSDPIRDLLAREKTIAVVGLSDSPAPESWGFRHMQSHGYKIIPVNPNIAETLGEKCYPSLVDVPLED